MLDVFSLAIRVPSLFGSQVADFQQNEKSEVRQNARTVHFAHHLRQIGA
jgi:hypothetical protein